jgi:signal transduction histidine kinase
VCAGFDAVGMWLQTYDRDDACRDSVYGATQGEIVVADEFKLLARAAAQRLWETQEVKVVVGGYFDDIPGLEVDDAQKARLGEFMADSLEADSMLFVPLGAGPECVGNMALTRRGDMAEWSIAEQQAALEVGHDLGRAMKNAQSFEQERILLEELRELEGYKSRLIATITHELRTPLTAVLGHLELVESIELPSAAAGSLQAIERGAQRMRAMVEDLLVLSQVADPHRPVIARPVDLGEVVVDVLELLETEIARKELRVVFDVPDEPVRVLGDMMALDWMCANLVGNAVKYTPPGGTITITIVPTDEVAEVSVNDDGIGISAEDRKRLFEEFFRATDPAVLTVPGNGLGLSIAQRIVEQHRGTIEVDSTLGQGATFTVRLPLSR